MAFTSRGPADEYRGRGESSRDRQRREEIQRHIQEFEEMGCPEETEEPSPTHVEPEQRVEIPKTNKKKRGRLWRFFIGD